MDDRSQSQAALHGTAVALLLAGAGLHYGWALVPVEHQAQVWNAAGAVVRAGLLMAVVWHVRSRWVLALAVWWLCEEAMVAGCSLAYILSPWEVLPGQAQCSALLQHDLGVYGLLAVALLAWKLPVRGDSYAD
jgi:hypothetical protein